jgi:serine/threonine protein kinase
MSPSPPDDLPLDRLCADQAVRWRNGERLRVEDYLHYWPPLGGRPDVLLALIANEVLLRRERGEQPALGEYLSRFPGLGAELPRAFPTEPDPPADDSTVQAPPPPPPDLPPPRRAAPPLPSVPGYQLLEFIDGGGQGDVFKARHLLTDRVVALKMLRDGAAQDAVQLARFHREGKLTARLDHPHIVRLYDFEEHAGRLYISMEFAEGGSLKARLEALGPLAPSDAALLLLTLARALDHAHGQGVVHRDLKPSNVLFTRDGSPKVADFGLAKRFDQQTTEVTRPLTVMGTAHYMAPEQAAGKLSQVGPPTDVWALGAILYECLTGRVPFDGESWLDTLDQVRFGPLTPPSRSRPGLPPALERICVRCLRKSAAERYAAAGALADDLQRFLAGQPLRDQPEEPTTSPSEPIAVPPSYAPDGPATLDSTVIAPPSAERNPAWPRIPGYEILEMLGRGGMGVVYKARQLSLSRLCALKTIGGAGEAAARWRRLLREEAQLTAGLSHPHIVQIYDLGEHAGLVYIAMEYVGGGTLLDVLRDGPPPPRRSAELLAPAAEALGLVHQRGLVHRDVKPSNLLLTPEGRAKVSDFGLARRVGRGVGPDAAEVPDAPPGAADAPEAEFHTHAGEIVGTPSYMAPEQAAGRLELLGPAADVWSLGATLYHLLTGRPPFQGATPLETLIKVEHEEPTPPGKLRPDVPPALEAICLKCLRKAAEQRYATGRDLAEDLQAFLAGRTPRALPGGFWQRMFFWRKT